MTAAGPGYPSILFLRFAIAVLTCFFLFGFLPESVSAQQVLPVEELELVDQSDWVTGGEPFRLELSVPTVRPDNLDIVVSIFNRVRTRSDFQRSLENRIAGNAIVLKRDRLNAVLGPGSRAQIEIPIQDSAQRQYFIRENGVYPVRVELQEKGTNRVVDRLVTHVINMPVRPQVQSRLDVATVLPARLPATPGIAELGSTVQDTSGLVALAASLGIQPEIPVSLVARPESLERLDSSPETRAVRDSLATAISARPVLGTTWTSVPPELYTTGLSTELDRQFSRGRDVLEQHFPAVSTQTWAGFDFLDTTALVNLRGRGIKQVIVREENLRPIIRDTTLARPFAISLGRNQATIPAAQADAGLASHFDDPGGPALTAHHLLADLAVIWNDRPSEARSVVVIPPGNFQAAQTFLDIYLRGLGNSPVVAPVGLDQLFAGPTEKLGRNVLARSLQTETPARMPVERIRTQRQHWVGFSSMVDQSNAVRDQLDRRLLYGESAGLDARQRSDELDAFDKLLNTQLGAIRVPRERALRLTSREGEIPVSVQNDTGYPVRVVLTLSSDRLQFKDGNRRELLVERQQVTERFAVEARSAGTFPVRVSVTSPDGVLEIGKSQVTLRSTVSSGVGIALTVGAGGFLIVWWVRSAIKTRRKRIG